MIVGEGQAEVSGLTILQTFGFLLIKLDGAHHGADLIHQHPALPVSHLPCPILLHLTLLRAQLQLLLEQLDLRTPPVVVLLKVADASCREQCLLSSSSQACQ